VRKLEAYDPAAEHEKELDGNACVFLFPMLKNILKYTQFAFGYLPRDGL